MPPSTNFAKAQSAVQARIDLWTGVMSALVNPQLSQASETAGT